MPDPTTHPVSDFNNIPTLYLRTVESRYFNTSEQWLLMTSLILLLEEVCWGDKAWAVLLYATPSSTKFETHNVNQCIGYGHKSCY